MSNSDVYLLRMQEVASGGYEVGALAELRNALIDDLSPEIHAAVLWGLSDTDDPIAVWWLGQLARRGAITEALPVLRAKLPGLPARRGVRDYRDDVRVACSHLESIAAGRCPCRTALGSPESWANMAIHENWVNQQAYTSEYRVYYKKCERRFRVTQDSNYHVAQYNWRPVPRAGPWHRPAHR
jgi:hypothetical protein